MDDKSGLAVSVLNACKSYKHKEVLKHLHMQVQRGTIYGLLGASGCGKTTLLTCLVGRRKLDSGELWVLGGQPGTKGSGVPGPRTGYMPQDAGLTGELTVRDSIYYFGRIMDMPDKLIKERFETLTDVMHLPPANRYVKHCSGGQQRRISFACAMVHMPELLILDEPTAGVDPVLRERIWDFLLKVTKTENMAVIITTHYIEEASQANVIGLMRDGMLLAQQAPEKLLQIFQTNSLEEVFLILSQKQEAGQIDESLLVQQDAHLNSSTFEIGHGSTDVLTKKEDKPKHHDGLFALNRKRLKALVDKNFKQFYRNIPIALFLCFFPIVEIVAFLLAIGGDVKNINIAIINKESMCENFTMMGTAIPNDGYNCDLDRLSCRFLTYLDHPMLNKVKYDVMDEAFEAVRLGKVVGVVYMAQNFTDSYQTRIDNGTRVGEVILEFSEIKVWLDMSNRQIGEAIKLKLLELFRKFQMDLNKDCDYDPKVARVFDLETIYGSLEDTFTVFMVPGIIMTIMFFMSTLLAGSTFVNERLEGIWDRAIIAGVSAFELTLTHLAQEAIIVILFTIEILTVTFVLFDIENIGSVATLALMAYLEGLAGLGFGFLISAVANSHSMALTIATGSFYFMIFICGLLWPLQGMPTALQYISRCLPFTVPIISFRNVMKKGWSLTQIEVWGGVGIEIIWIVGLILLNTILIKAKR